MKQAVFLSLVALAVAGGGASRVAHSDAAPVPCLNTGAAGGLEIQLAGPTGVPAQRVFGTLSSWDPTTSTIGFKSDLSNRVEKVPVRAIRFTLPQENLVAQEAIPTRVPLGSISRGFAATDVTVKDGVLKFPGCVLEHNGNPVVFQGGVTFEGSEVLLEGNVLEIQSPTGGGASDSTSPKGG